MALKQVGLVGGLDVGQTLTRRGPWSQADGCRRLVRFKDPSIGGHRVVALLTPSIVASISLSRLSRRINIKRRALLEQETSCGLSLKRLQDGSGVARCQVFTETGAVFKDIEAIDIISWERLNSGFGVFRIRTHPEKKCGTIQQEADNKWSLCCEDQVAQPLMYESVDGLLSWAADAVLAAAAVDLEYSEIAQRLSRTDCIVQGSGIVCFDAAEFIRRLRSSAVQFPIMMPHGALRLQSQDLLDLVNYSNKRLADLESVDHIAEQPGVEESLVPLLRTGRCQNHKGGVAGGTPNMVTNENLTYLTESPLKCSDWFFGEAASSTPDLLEAVMASAAWRASPSLPLLWAEEDSKFFLGDAGSYTVPHRDILWLPQLSLVLTGEKVLQVENLEQDPSESNVETSAIIARAGDLFAFNASGVHTASNVGSSPTASLYQGFLPISATPRFSSAPGRSIGDEVQYDGIAEVLRPTSHARRFGEVPLVERLEQIRQNNERCSEGKVLAEAAKALAAAEERLKLNIV